MSTKTSIKRIALVAVSALGFGLLSVVPAKAATSSIRLDGTPALIIRTDAGADASWTVEASGTGIIDTGNIKLQVKRNSVELAAVPSGITVNWTDANTDTDGANTNATDNSLVVEFDQGDTTASAADDALAAVTIGRTLAPGKYDFLFSEGAADGSAYDDAVTFTIYVSTAPTSWNLSATSGSVDAGDTKTFTLGVKDAQGNPSYLLAGESGDLAVSGGVSGATKPTIDVPFVDSLNIVNTSTTGPTVTINANPGGAAATAGSYTITVSRASGLTGVANATYAITVGAAPVASSALGLSSYTAVNRNTNGNGVFDEAGDVENSTDGAYDPVYVSTATPSLTFVGFTDANDLTTGNLRFAVSAHSTAAYPNGVAAVTASDVAVTDTTGAGNKSKANYTVTAVSPVAGSGYRVSVKDGAAVQGLEITYQSPVPNSVTLDSPASTPVLALKGSSNTASAIVKDQFGVVIANIAVAVAITGRNAQSRNLTSDANGVVTYTWSDTYVESTTNTATADTVVFTVDGQQPTGAPADVDTATLVINYKSSITAGSVTLTGLTEGNDGNQTYTAADDAVAADGTTELVVRPNNTLGNDTITDQAQLKVLVKDTTVAAAVMEGLPVVFSATDGVYFATSSNGAAATSVPVAGSTAKTTLTVYTDSNGLAWAQVRVTKVGTATFTVTSGGITKTLSVDVLTDDGWARNISTSNASGNAGSPATVTATVKDAWGNVVSGVAVSAVATNGVFLNGLNAISGDTDASGNIVVQVNASSTAGGSTSVKFTVTENSQVADLASTDTTLAFTAGNATATSTVTFTGTPAKSAEVLASEAAEAEAKKATTTAGEAKTEAAAATAAATTAGTKADAAKAEAALATAAATTAGTKADAAKTAADAATAAATKAGTDAVAAADAAKAEAAKATAAAAANAVEIAKILAAVTALKSDTSAADAYDAALEAIDAANGATDAAQLAMDAADAATVAAEEARDAADAATAAVEELATQVSTLIAGLKAQLTTLANTVAKIAKKVKA